MMLLDDVSVRPRDDDRLRVYASIVHGLGFCAMLSCNLNVKQASVKVQASLCES